MYTDQSSMCSLWCVAPQHACGGTRRGSVRPPEKQPCPPCSLAYFLLPGPPRLSGAWRHFVGARSAEHTGVRALGRGCRRRDHNGFTRRCGGTRTSEQQHTHTHVQAQARAGSHLVRHSRGPRGGSRRRALPTAAPGRWTLFLFPTVRVTILEPPSPRMQASAVWLRVGPLSADANHCVPPGSCSWHPQVQDGTHWLPENW
jgi:hypothetical protein